MNKKHSSFHETLGILEKMHRHFQTPMTPVVKTDKSGNPYMPLSNSRTLHITDHEKGVRGTIINRKGIPTHFESDSPLGLAHELFKEGLHKSTSISDIIKKLNELRAYELRQANLYRIAAQMVTGPSREATVEEFHDHADDELEHADHAMSRIMGLGGDIDSNVLPVPVFRNLDEVLKGIEKFEEDGIKEWQALMKMLPEDDSFRHVIESILETETEHYNDIKRFLRKDFMAKSNNIPGAVPLNWQTPQLAEDPIIQHQNSWAVKAREDARQGTPATLFNGGAFGRHEGLTPNLAGTRHNPPLLLKSCEPKDIGDKVVGEHKENLDKGDEAGFGSLREMIAAKSNKKKIKKSYSFLKSHGKKLQKSMSTLNPLMQGSNLSDPYNSYKNTNINDQEPPIGQTGNGSPIFNDPYHQAHAAFGPQDHMAAGQFQEALANQLMAQGNTVASLGARQKANIHSMLAEQAKSPSERAYERIIGANRNDPLNRYTNQNSVSPDQNKPIVPQTGERMGPVPGMRNTLTGTAMGPQTQNSPFAGTYQQPVVTPNNYSQGDAGYDMQPGQDNYAQQMPAMDQMQGQPQLQAQPMQVPAQQQQMPVEQPQMAQEAPLEEQPTPEYPYQQEGVQQPAEGQEEAPQESTEEQEEPEEDESEEDTEKEEPKKEDSDKKFEKAINSFYRFLYRK